MGPTKKKPDDPKQPKAEDTRGKHPGNRAAPAAAERTGEETAPAPADDSKATTTTVTNHDEQEKITNADDADNPIAEK